MPPSRTACKRTRLVVAFARALVALVVVAAMGLAGLRAAGFIPFSVLSNSMAPTYHAGDLVYVLPQEPESIETGDVIAFCPEAHTDGVGGPPSVVMHRVIQADQLGRTFITKGDANRETDAEPVAYDRMIGKAAWSLPCLGRVSDALSRALFSTER